MTGLATYTDAILTLRPSQLQKLESLGLVPTQLSDRQKKMRSTQFTPIFDNIPSARLRGCLGNEALSRTQLS
ncbi:Uncharacterized protein HZ326_30953 [Fusarium oxysporum f. sp. albedinis]|nr:Uncharacterized protein HZ326_30953 [Fusarium oxysporum f. sp. albedinis]